MKFLTPKRVSAWQYKRNEKGALVRDKQIIITLEEPYPTTVGGLIKKSIYEKGEKLHKG